MFERKGTMQYLDQAKIGIRMDDRGRNCHVVFLRGVICYLKGK